MTSKELTKYLDKFHAALCKEYDEDTATGIVNDVLKTKLIPYMCINLRMGAAESMEVIYKCAKTIKQFKDVIMEYVEILVMSSLMFPESMKVALDIYEDCNVSKFSKKFNPEMLTCLYKHAMNFPENKTAIMDCIRKYATPEFVLYKPFMFLTDEVDIIQPHFTRGEDEKKNLYNLCIDADAVNTLLKAARYHKESNAIICKLGLSTLLENLKYIDIKNPLTRIKIYDEMVTFNRWELLPFVFEELRPEGKEWDMFRIGLYQGYTNSIFLKTLFYFMEKYEIPIETLKNPKNTMLMCSSEVFALFNQYGLEKTFNVREAEYMSEYVSPGMSSLFYAFTNKRYKYIVEYMHMSASNYNSRFIRERAYLNTLVSENKLGWDSDMNIKWKAFIQFTYEVIDELNTLDRCLAKYNSFHSIATMVEPMISIRLINDVHNTFRQIKNIYILGKCTDFVDSINYYKEQILKEVRDYIGIDLPANQEWELPENPTLEDYFKYVYQYSNFGDDSYEEGLALITKLYNAGCVKIAQECYIALSKFVPLVDLKKILMLRNVLPM